jgi:hypothetical protein
LSAETYSFKKSCKDYQLESQEFGEWVITGKISLQGDIKLNGGDDCNCKRDSLDDGDLID